MVAGHDKFAGDEKAGCTSGWDMFPKAQIRQHSNSKDSYVSTGLSDVFL